MRCLSLAMLGLASLSPAQVTVSATAFTDLVATAAVPGQPPVTNVIRTGQPVATLVAQAGSTASGRALALFAPSMRALASSAEFVVVELATAGPGSATLGPHEHLIAFQGPAGLPVRVEVDWRLFAPAGAPLPQVAVDVGNDGVFEFVTPTPNRVILVRTTTLGTGTLPIRLRTAVAGAAGGMVNNQVYVRVLPGDPVAVQEVLTTCGGGRLTATPLFGRRLELAHTPNALDPQVLHALVVGCSRAPVVLPSQCVGLPAQDAVVLIDDPVRALLPPFALDATAQVVALDFGRGLPFTSNALGIAVR